METIMVPRITETQTVKIKDGPWAEIRIEPLRPEESNSKWATSLVIDFGAAHSGDKMLRAYLTKEEAQDIGYALIKAVTDGYKADDRS